MSDSFSHPAEGRPNPSRQRHWEMLVIAVVVIVASFALCVPTPDRVAPIWARESPLPPLCLSRELLGVSCPGCGLTRSFVHLAHGNWHASWQAHHLGILLALMVVLQIPYRLHGLRRPERPLLSRAARNLIAYTLIALLIANWLIGLMA